MLYDHGNVYFLLCILVKAINCSREPPNPTSSMLVQASVSYTNYYGGSPYPYGTLAEFKCPDGYKWAPVTEWETSPYKKTHTINDTRTTVTVECLGTLAWSMYDVTECINASKTEKKLQYIFKLYPNGLN
jgi:hypothetical protein